MLTKIIFIWMVATGVVIPAGTEDYNERQTYHLILDEDYVIEYAYEAEILKYIETGVFMYDDFLED